MAGFVIATPPLKHMRSAWLWSALLAAAVVAPAVPRITAPRRSSTLEVTLTGTRAGTVELFYDLGRGYNGSDMSCVNFAAGTRTNASLPLPDGVYRQLRLDPTTCRDEVVIESLGLRDVATGTLVEVPLSAVAAGHGRVRVAAEGHRARVVSDGEDPILFIEFPQPLRVGSGVRPRAVPRVAALFLATTAVIGGVWTAGRLVMRRRSAFLRRAAVLAALGCLLAAPRLVALDRPLLDFHDFRQTQTAITAHWFAVEGVTLPAYPLPVLGRPWTVPFEFPLYQLVVAALHRLGVPLDAAARGTALLAFSAAMVLVVRMLHRHGAPHLLTAGFAIFALASPFALVWSKASLIEFTAVLCGVLFAGLAADAHAHGLNAVRWLLLVAAGTTAALVKITTLVAFWPAGALLAADRVLRLWRERAGMRRVLVAVVAWGAALVVPLVIGRAWIAATDAVKASAAATIPLTSSQLGMWTYGTLDQRLDYRNWRAIAFRIGGDVLPFLWPLALLGVGELGRLPRRIALVGSGMLVGAGLVVTAFFNLYVVHDYYLSAVVVPVWLAGAAGLWGVARRLPADGPRRLVLPATLGLLIVAASRSYLVWHSYAGHGGEELLAFCREVRRAVPADAEVLVVGDDWNPRLPYYMRRKALMAWPPLPERFVRDYVAANDVRDLVVCRTGDVSALRWFPESDLVSRVGPYELRRLPPVPP